MPILTEDQIKNAPPGELPSSILFKKNTREIKTAKKTPLVGVQGKKRTAADIVNEAIGNPPVPKKKPVQSGASVEWRPQPQTARLLQKNPVGNVDIYDINHQVSVLKDVYKKHNLGSVIHPGIAAGVVFAPIVAEAIPRLFDSPRVQEVVRRVSERYQPEYLLKTAQILKDPGAFIGGVVGQKLIDIPVVKDILIGAQREAVNITKLPAQELKRAVETSGTVKLGILTPSFKLPWKKTPEQLAIQRSWKEKADNYIKNVNTFLAEEKSLQPKSETAALIGGTGFSLATAIITGLATKSLPAAAAMFGMRARGAAYERSRAAGLKPEKAATFADVEFATETGLEYLGLHLLLKPTTGLVGVAKKMLSEATQESSQEVASAATATVGGYEDRTLDAIAKDVVLSGAIGAVMGGAVGVGVDLATERKTIADISKTYGVAKNDAKTIVTEVLPKFQKILADQGGFVDFSKAKTTKQQIAQSTGLAPSEQITASESSLLKGQIKQQVKGAKVGARAGRLEIYEKLKNQEADTNETRADVEQYIVEKLPKELRGNFLKTVRTIKPNQQKKLAKTFVRVDALAQKYQKKQTIGDIKKLDSRIQKADVVDSDFKEFSRLITNELTYTKPSKSRRMSLKKKVDYLEREIAKGNKPYWIHYKAIQMANLLSRKPVQDLTQAELNAIKLKLDVALNTGKSQRATSKSQLQQKARSYIQALKEGNIQPVKKGRVLSQLNLRKRNLGEMSFSLTPIDTVLDMPDSSSSDFNEAHYSTFAGTVNTDLDNFLTGNFDVREEIRKRTEPLNLTEEQFNKVGLYANVNQPGGLQRVGLTKAEAAKIKLTKEEKAFYDLSREIYDRYYPLIAEIYKVLENKKLPQIENYSPFYVDFDKMEDTEVVDIFANPVLRNPKYYRASQTKTRGVKSIAPLKINALENLTKWVENAEYYINMSENLKILKNVTNSQEYKNLIQNDIYLNQVQEWLGLMAKKGGTNTSNWMDVLRHNAVKAIIPFKAATSFVQLTAMVDGATEVGLRRMTLANEALWSQKTKDFVKNNFPQLAHRNIRESDYANFSNKEKFAKMTKAGTKVLRIFDHWAANATGYAAYIKYLEENNLELDLDKPNKKAIAYAEGVVRRTQASSMFAHQPAALTRGTFSGNKSFDKAILMLNNFLLTRWNRITYQRIGKVFRTRSVKDAGKAISYLMYLTFATLGETLIREAVNRTRRNITGEYRAPEKLYDKAWMEAGRNIPLLGNIMAATQYDSDIIGAFRGAESLREGVYGVYTRKTRPARVRASIRALEGLGTMVGLPGSPEAAMWLRSIVNARDKKKQRQERGKARKEAEAGVKNIVP